MYTTFKLENRSDILLKRLDVRGYNTQWFSIFSHRDNLLMVRPNGDWVTEKMTYLTDQMMTHAINNYRRSIGQGVLPSNDTITMLRRHAQEETAKCRGEEEQLAHRKAELKKELVELGKAGNELMMRRERLKAETEMFQREQEYLKTLKALATYHKDGHTDRCEHRASRRSSQSRIVSENCVWRWD